MMFLHAIVLPLLIRSLGIYKRRYVSTSMHHLRMPRGIETGMFPPNWLKISLAENTFYYTSMSNLCLRNRQLLRLPRSL